MNKILKCFFVLLLVVCPTIAQSATIPLSWIPCPTNTDGSPLVDIMRYDLYKSTTSSNYSVPFTNFPYNITNTTVTVTDAILNWVGSSYTITTTPQTFTITWDPAISSSNATYFSGITINSNNVPSDMADEYVYWQSAIFLNYKMTWGITTGSQPNIITGILTNSTTFNRSAFPKTMLYFRPLGIDTLNRTNIFNALIPINNKKPGKFSIP